MIDRRSAIGAMGVGLALAATPAKALAAPVSSLDTPEGRMRSFMLMRGALDDRLVIGYLQGRYWGSVNGSLTSLFDVVAANFSRYRRQADGSYYGVSVEQSFFVDSGTGEWLKSFVNPYTGKTVTVPTSRNPPAALNFTTELQMKMASSPPGFAMNHSVSPFAVQEDDVTITETTTAGISGKPTSYQAVVGLHARLSEINQRRAKKVRCETSYTSVSRWPAWLEMGDGPGEVVATGQGVYGAKMSGLPKAWVAAARSHRPELLTNPRALLDPLWRVG